MSRILVADDSIAVRKVAERLLTEAGFQVVLAANGEEAVACLLKDGADAVVCDVIMPDKSGYEICTFVRNHPQLATTPVLLISGIVNDEVIQQAQSCGASGVLKKPFQGTSLKDKVAELLAKNEVYVPSSAEGESTQTQRIDECQSDGGESSGPNVDVSPPSSSPESGGELEDAPERAKEGISQEEGGFQAGDRLKELEKLLHEERVRAESLAGRVAELERDVSNAKESAREIERLLEEERRRTAELQSQVVILEREASRVTHLEAMLKEAQESAATARREADALKRTSETIAQLEAALHTEQEAAAQLVQQMNELEQEAARGKNAELTLAKEQERNAALERKANEAEAALLAARGKLEEMESKLEAERRKAGEYERRLAELEARATKMQGLKVLLSAERERSAEIAQKLAETEWVAMNATRRLEEMASKLREIASMASELSKGIGEPKSGS